VQGHRVRLPRGEVNYSLGGSAAAPLLVCIHGLNGALSSFAAFEPHLSLAGFRVLCFDLYGFGLSASPNGRLDLETYVDQVQLLLKAIQVPADEQVFLLGYSMGGVVAVEFARRFPEKVARLLLVAPSGLMKRSNTPCQPLLFGCLRARCGGCLLHSATLLALCCGCFVRRALRGPNLADKFQMDVREPEKFRALAALNGERFLWNLRRSVNSYLRALKRMPLWEEDFQESYAELAKSAVPVLFIWGDADCTVPFGEAEHEVRRLFGPRGDSCIQIPEAGHGLLVEDSAQVASCAVAWFSNKQDPRWQQCLNYWRLPGLTPASGPEAAVVGSDASGVGNNLAAV